MHLRKRAKALSLAIGMTISFLMTGTTVYATNIKIQEKAPVEVESSVGSSLIGDIRGEMVSTMRATQRKHIYQRIEESTKPVMDAKAKYQEKLSPYDRYVNGRMTIYDSVGHRAEIGTLERCDKVTCVGTTEEQTMILYNNNVGYVETSKLSEKQVPKYRISISDAELNMLYKCVMAEGGGESYQCQRMIAEVIINRVISGKFPNTVQGVISAPGQFSVYPNLMNKRTPSASVISACQEALKSASMPEGVMYFRAGHFFSSRKAYMNVDNTYFSY